LLVDTVLDALLVRLWRDIDSSCAHFGIGIGSDPAENRDVELGDEDDSKSKPGFELIL
jgi:hypothetical protein